MILLVMTDGRDDVLDQAIRSAGRNLCGEFTHFVIHDDAGMPSHAEMLAERYPTAEVVGGDRRRGFGGAIANAWSHLKDRPERFVFHLEDDFVFNGPVDLGKLAATLDANPHLVQVALRRQAWNPQEVVAGGIVEQHPDDYTQVSGLTGTWLEHRRFFTTNPNLYRLDLTQKGWPDAPHSEGHFGIEVFKDHAARSAFWGPMDSSPMVHHIGEHRVGTGY